VVLQASAPPNVGAASWSLAHEVPFMDEACAHARDGTGRQGCGEFSVQEKQGGTQGVCIRNHMVM
jgi:hypothetical protein